MERDKLKISFNFPKIYWKSFPEGYDLDFGLLPGRTHLGFNLYTAVSINWYKSGSGFVVCSILGFGFQLSW